MSRTRTVVLLTSNAMGWADVRASLAVLTEVAVADEVRDPDALIAAVRRVGPDAVLMPSQFDGESTVLLIATIREAAARAPHVVLFAQAIEFGEVAAALRAGATGFIVMSDVEVDDLPAELRSLIASGVMLLSRSAREPLRTILTACPVRNDRPVPELSERQFLVLRDIAAGLQRKEIAQKQQISVRSVDRAVGGLRLSLGARTNGELVAKAIELTLLP